VFPIMGNMLIPKREWITAARKHKGLTHRGLAALLGVSHVAVVQWESGTRRPSYDRILMLADLLGPEVLANFEAEARAKGVA